MLNARIVLVDHDAGDHLHARLDELVGVARELVVVDNASTDDSWRAAERPDVTLIRLDENLGFAAGANVGAAEAATDWLVFCNPDASMSSAHVTQLLTTVPADVGIIAPVQVDGAGRPRPESGGQDLTLARLFVWAVIPARIRGHRGPWLAPPFPEGEEDVDWVSGAVMAVRRDLFARLGGFDDRYFLYLEDADLCRRARLLAARVICRGNVRVRHDPAQGEPARRTNALRSSVDAHLQWFSGRDRPIAAICLALGYGIRALGGVDGAAGAARHALRSLRPR